ncbi:MAG: SDR family oxidoreductase [Alphaproteobacteria bacterium]|nr:SDR family oxidoreductase [Alphaproteobacteria bacterium]
MAALSGQVALITGASAPRGIGRAIAQRLATDGAAVVITDMTGSFTLDDTTYDRTTLLAEMAAEIDASGGTALALTLDVTSDEDIARYVGEAMSRFGRIDILVNNAGSLAGSANFMETTPAQWNTGFQVNLLGPVKLCQAVIPAMRAQGGGRIINIGSTGSRAGFRCLYRDEARPRRPLENHRVRGGTARHPVQHRLSWLHHDRYAHGGEPAAGSRSRTQRRGAASTPLRDGGHSKCRSARGRRRGRFLPGGAGRPVCHRHESAGQRRCALRYLRL